MNKYLSAGIMMLLVGMALAACNFPSTTSSASEVDLAGTIVAETLQAQSEQADRPASQETEETEQSDGTVEGQICYPSSGTKDMEIYFSNTDTGQITELAIAAGTNAYSQDLAPGVYVAFAWMTDFTNSGSYSACGMQAACNDATPLPFTVSGGQTLAGIDICDWSHGPFDIPYPPGFQPTVTLGQIDGEIGSYPFGDLPQLAIVVYSQDTPYWYWIGTAEGQVYFSFTELASGPYLVVAYDSMGHAGGAPAIAQVTAGGSTYVVISDWSGAYPPKPASVP